MNQLYFQRGFLTNNLITPDIVVCDASGHELDIISPNLIKDFKITALLNGMWEMSFKIYKYYNSDEGNSIENPVYGVIDGNTFNTFKTKGYGSWCLTEHNESIGSSIYTEYKAKSLEYEFTKKKVYPNAPQDDESTDNMYKIVDYIDTSHSILHVALKEFPDWRIGEVSSNLPSTYHDLSDFDEASAYDFLTNIASESFNAVFIFDTEYKTVSVYTQDDPTICKDSNIYLSYNLIKSFTKTSNLNEIVTCLRVSGQTDETTGQSMGIIDVNPTMSNEIMNVEWFYPKFSDGLKTVYNNYKRSYESYKPLYEQTSASYDQVCLDIENLNNKEGHDGVWSEYGLSQLKIARDANLVIISNYSAINSTVTDTQKNIASQNYNAIMNEIVYKSNQINTKETEKQTLYNTLCNICENMKIRNYTTEEQWIELGKYIRKDNYNNSTIAIYETDTNAERVSKQKELMNLANEELENVCQPKFEIKMTVANFLQIPEFREYADQVQLGTCFHIDYDENMKGKKHICARLLKVEFDFENKENVTLTFSNRDSLSEEFKSILQQAQGASTSLSFNMSNIKAGAKAASDFGEYYRNDRNLMKERIVTDSQNVQISEAGILVQAKTGGDGDNATFDPRKMLIGNAGLVLTENNFTDSVVGIGLIKLKDGTYAWGINAQCIYADLILSEKTHIENRNNTVDIGENGIIVRGLNNTCIIDPNSSDGVFQILKGIEKKIWLDSSGNGNFSGNVVASYISGSNIYGSNITAGSISGSNIYGSSFETEDIGNNAYITLRDGNMFIEGSNGYIRGSLSNNSYAKLIGISSYNNMVIGHDDAYYSLYGGSRIDINCYTNNFRFRQNSNGGKVNLTNGGYSIIDESNIGGYISSANSSLESSLKHYVIVAESNLSDRIEDLKQRVNNMYNDIEVLKYINNLN